jgi:TonB-linked SusC/RagA family outer membrane protein
MREKILTKPYLLKCTSLLLLWVVSFHAFAQITVSVHNKSLRETLKEVEKASDYRFFYSESLPDLDRITAVQLTEGDIEAAMQQMLAGTNIEFRKGENNVIVLVERTATVQTSAQSAQPITVRGRVTDAANEPVIGATIIDRDNPGSGTVTDIDGNYTLQGILPNATIVISYVGMASQTINVNNRTTINVAMDDDSELLQEVVVTALGIRRDARSVGYAVTTVGGEGLTAGREMNMMNALSGRIAGVDISPTSAGPSGSTRVVIRGNSQLTGSNAPLYVIDGVPMDNTQLGEAGRWGGMDMGDGLSAINPDDIESISVLRGASASALYGSRASNGVVLITTKSGSAQQGLGIEFSSSVDAVTMLSSMNDYQRVYGQGRAGMMPLNDIDARGTTQSAWGAKLDQNIQALIFNGQRMSYGNVENNIMSFFRAGTTLTNSVALSGGNDRTTYRASISDMRNNDIIPNSDMSRTTFMMRGDTKLGERMRIESRVNYTIEKVNNRPALSDSPNNIGTALIGLAPNFNQAWLGGEYKDRFDRYIDWNGGNIYRINPYWSINEMMNESAKNRVMGHFQFEYDILPWLTFHAKAGTDFFDFNLNDFQPISTPTAREGQLIEQRTNVAENNFEGMLRMNRRFDHFDISAFIGGNIRQNVSQGTTNVGRSQVLPGLVSISNYERYQTPAPLYRAKQVNSMFGSVNAGYKDFLYGEFSIRNDISSTLHRDHRSYVYPSVSGSFVFTQLWDMRNTPVSFGRVRASWAQVGGDTDPYQLSMTYNLRDFTFHGSALGQVSNNVIANQFLKPTSTDSYETGFDIRFFNNRLGLDVGLYNSSTTNQIMMLPISQASGYSFSMINAGKIRNSGIEVSINMVPVQTLDFEWNANLNFASHKNEVVSLHEEVEHFELAQARWANAFIYATPGMAYGVIMGQAFARDPRGNIIHRNGMPTYTENMEVLGNGVHNLIMGFSNSFTYKQFNLGMLFDARFGADIYSMSDMMAHANGTSKNTLPGRADWYDSEERRQAANMSINDWTPTGGLVGNGVMNIGTDANPNFVPNNVYVDPQLYWQQVTRNTAEPFVHNASFIKLRELNVAYNFSRKALERTPMQGASVSLYGRNLFILHTHLKNIDPESNFNSGNGQGFEYGSLPSRRNFGVSVNLKF